MSDVPCCACTSQQFGKVEVLGLIVNFIFIEKFRLEGATVQRSYSSLGKLQVRFLFMLT